MLVVRPVHAGDLEALLELAELTSFGLTTLPRDAGLLSRRIRDSVRALANADEGEPRGETYLFVLEDLADGRVIGTSGIHSKVGGFQPFYAYRLETTVVESKMLGKRREIETLHLVTEHDGPSEIGSLFLHPGFRRGDLGRLLSISRFLFMACHPKLFDDQVIAEIRGVVDEQGRSPFWDALGRHFFDMEFPKADYLSIVNKEFIGDLMPRHPIPVPVLPPEARAVIGVAHPQSRAALRILESEGFRFSGMVDIFEAGPCFVCRRRDVRSVRESVEARVARIVPSIEGPAEHVVAAAGGEWRACATALESRGDDVELPLATAEALGVRAGDVVRHVRARAR
jgi:arginine N-succinyltransferase